MAYHPDTTCPGAALARPQVRCSSDNASLQTGGASTQWLCTSAGNKAAAGVLTSPVAEWSDTRAASPCAAAAAQLLLTVLKAL